MTTDNKNAAASPLSDSDGSQQTNREAHEEAAGMNLCGAFFANSGIDPDAPYIPPDNSSGVCRPSAEAADYIQYLEDGIREVIEVRLKFASDKQYGKGELKALLSSNVAITPLHNS